MDLHQAQRVSPSSSIQVLIRQSAHKLRHTSNLFVYPHYVLQQAFISPLSRHLNNIPITKEGWKMNGISFLYSWGCTSSAEYIEFLCTSSFSVCETT
jgi:hypothetical protein